MNLEDELMTALDFIESLSARVDALEKQNAASSRPARTHEPIGALDDELSEKGVTGRFRGYEGKPTKARGYWS